MVFPEPESEHTLAGRRSRCWRAIRPPAQLIENRILLVAALAVAVLAVLVLAIHDDDVRVLWQVFIRNMTGKVAGNWTRYACHHRAGRIDDWIAPAEIKI